MGGHEEEEEIWRRIILKCEDEEEDKIENEGERREIR